MDDWLIDKLAAEYEENGCGRLLPTDDEKLHDALFPRKRVLDEFFGGPTKQELDDIAPIPKGAKPTDSMSDQSRFFIRLRMQMDQKKP